LFQWPSPSWLRSDLTAAKTQGAKFLRITPAQQSMARFTPGGVFPIYNHSMSIDTAAHHLPPVGGPWNYYALGGFIYRTSARNARVLPVAPGHQARGPRAAHHSAATLRFRSGAR
jgi:hypothetical protein